MEDRARSVPVTLRAHADAWARLALADKVSYLRTMRARTVETADEWVRLAASAKGIAGTPLEGEEWLSGPYPVLTAIDRLSSTLEAIARDGTPPIPDRAIHVRPDGTVSVDVFPLDLADRIVLGGVHAEVCMQPGVTRANLREHIAAFYRRRDPRGTVTLVLGAGNIAAIPALDVLTVLFAHGSVVVLKLNPVNAYLAPVFRRVFDALVDDGFVEIVVGGADVGARLCADPDVDAIHLTGGERTHDAIVFGPGPEGAARKRAGTPLLAKPVTSELGNVTPVVVVAGAWSDADIARQAAHVASQKLHNAGANCIAAQVLVVPAAWPLAARFVEAVRAALAAAPARPFYYPGSPQQLRFAGGLDANDGDEPLFRTEAFGPVLGQTALPGDDAATFLRNAVAFCNDRLRGTLGATIIADPRTVRELGAAFDDALAALRYGTVAVNTWPGLAFTLPGATWGAYPGGTLADVGSGIGIVHNAFLFERPQKTIVRAPFRPFPRTPPWFVTHRRAREVGRAVFRYTAKPTPLRLLTMLAAAVRA